MYQQTLYNQSNKIDISSSIDAAILDLKEQKIGFANNLLNLDTEIEIKRVVDEISQSASTLIVFGIGGSLLGSKAYIEAIDKTKNVHFVDYIDPTRFNDLLNSIDLNETAFIAISKSGHTLEVIAQIIATIKFFREQSDKLQQRFYFLTGDPNSKIGRIAKDFKKEIILHDQTIGGRFSCFSNVGLIPALFASCDIDAFRTGARMALNNFITQNDHLVKDSVKMAVNCIEGKQSTFVFMPYIHSLSAYNDWTVQLISESTGKNGHGITPLKCMGTIDQHSILQLFLDGPRDKYFTFINTSHGGSGENLNSRYVNELDITMGDLLDIQYRATFKSLVESKLPVRTIELNNLSEHTLGALMMNMFLEIITLAKYYDFNPFEQNAVEAIKSNVREILAKHPLTQNG